MNKKVLVIAVALMAVAMLATPVKAKTKTEIYAVQSGGVDFTTADKILATPNGRMHFFWGVEGTGVSCTLYEADQVTVIDTFATSSVFDIKGKDSTSAGFLNGVLVAHVKMLWESNTYEDSGFEGVAQWRADDVTPHVITIKGVYQGFGHYAGQTLQLEGTRMPGAAQIFTGTLLA